MLTDGQDLSRWSFTPKQGVNFLVIEKIGQGIIDTHDPDVVLILNCISKHVAHASRKIGLFEKKNPIRDSAPSNKMP